MRKNCPLSLSYPKFLSSVFQLQQLEEAELKQKEANLAALAAIGPRKKRTLEQTEVSLPDFPKSCCPTAMERHLHSSFMHINIGVAILFGIY